MCVKNKENSSNNIPPLVNVPAICIGLFLSNIFPCNALAKSVFCSEIISADNERERERVTSCKNLSIHKKAICHTERKRSIQNENSANNAFLQSNFNLHKSLDTSVASLPQYDKEKANIQYDKNIDCHALDSAKMQNLIARNDNNVKSCNDRISLSFAEDFAFCPPSLAEGARGWVSCHTSAQAQNIQNFNSCHTERKRSIQNADSTNNAILQSNVNLQNYLESTHPQTPSAREGAIRGVATLAREGEIRLNPSLRASATSVAIHKNNANAIDCHDSSLFIKSLESLNDTNQINPQKYIKLAQIDFIKTDSTQTESSQNQNQNDNASNETAHQKAYATNSSDTDSSQAYEQLQAKDLGKVTASAPKIQDNILDTQSRNVIIIDKNDLQEKGYTNLEQALQHQPSITLIPAANGQSQIDIRGQGLDASKSIKTFINGVPINPNDTGYGASRNGFALNGTNPFNLVDINDIESIEVLPGGGSVIYGGGTRGGVVNIVTKKPSKDYARVSLEGIAYEAKDRLNGKASVGGGANIKDKVFLSANASYAYKNGLRPNEYNKNAYASLQTYYQINDKHRLDFSANYSKSYQFFAGYNNKFSTASQEKSISQMKSERYATPTQATSNGKVEQDLATASLKYIADFRESLQFNALAFYSFSDFLFPDIAGDPSSASANITGTNSTHNTGLFAKIKHSTKSNKLFVGLDNNVEISYANSGSSDKRGGVRYSGALYVLDSFMPSQYFSLTGGARGEVVYYDVARTAVVGFSGFTNFIAQTATQKDVKANYAFELTPAFHYGENSNVYIKGEIGFISPSVAQIVNAVSQSATTKELRNTNIKPEQYFTGEIGWRDEFRFSSFLVSAYYTHSFNEIRYIYQTAVRNFYNLGETQRFGFEFVSRQKLFGEILALQESINVNYSNVLKGRDNTANFNNHSTGASDASQEGKQIPYVPLTKISLLANLQALKKGKHRLNVFYNNSYYGQSVDNNYVAMNKGGYVLGDIGITYGYGGFSINTGVRNLYDSFYVVYQASSAGNAILGTQGTRTYLAGEGRNYYLTLKYDF